MEYVTDPSTPTAVEEMGSAVTPALFLSAVSAMLIAATLNAVNQKRSRFVPYIFI